ncbi:ATP synthase F1 subunit epsilon [Candidatus Dojkabacteria bacterium]|uniref:ATP synthase epsilon chain n=1 Tax=Candidatus Dojkabacteria bacterium TaxID=2099670 RepID=A0A955L5C7_9BACT|nr:ATP synthase F1 subunit epsilon [Candidatus Dojkabacteria bacterium]
MKLKVVSSSQELLTTDKVDAVFVTTTDGEIGLLPGHVNLVATLEVGEMRYKLNGEFHPVLISGGIVQFKDDEILILADEADLPDNLVKEEISSAIRNAEEQLSGELEPAELIQLEKKLRYEKFKERRVLS